MKRLPYRSECNMSDVIGQPVGESSLNVVLSGIATVGLMFIMAGKQRFRKTGDVCRIGAMSEENSPCILEPDVRNQSS